MQTRSQTAKERAKERAKEQAKEQAKELPVNIDFDEASKAWRENKIKLKNGCYKYKKAKNVFRRGQKAGPSSLEDSSPV
jgi:hypothetical protein